jgi:hypothetical protein
MPEATFIGTIAVYVVLAVLLVSLNIYSRWRWWLKAAAIIVTCGCFFLAYFSIAGMIGWPSSDHLPKRFSVVATRTVEPDRLQNRPGYVYLWVEELNENSVPVTPPRGYELTYSPKLADNADAAQKKLNSGEEVMGQSSGGVEGKAKTQSDHPSNDSGQITGKVGQGEQPTGETTAAETIDQGEAVVFSDMPAVTLPDKSDVATPP